MKTKRMILAGAAVMAMFVTQTSEAHTDEASMIDQALTASLSELNSSQDRMNFGDDSHRQFRDTEVDKNQRIEVDPNESTKGASSAKN